MKQIVIEELTCQDPAFPWDNAYTWGDYDERFLCAIKIQSSILPARYVLDGRIVEPGGAYQIMYRPWKGSWHPLHDTASRLSAFWSTMQSAHGALPGMLLAHGIQKIDQQDAYQFACDQQVRLSTKIYL